MGPPREGRLSHAEGGSREGGREGGRERGSMRRERGGHILSVPHRRKAEYKRQPRSSFNVL